MMIGQQFKIIKTASTGTASVNISGCTIDSILNLHGCKNNLIGYDEETKKKYLKNNELEQADYIVIDEISMIDGRKFDEIIKRIKFVNKFRKEELKLIIVGDCMQLPPVEGKDYGYFFNGAEYDEIHKLSYICKLKEVKRQDNQEFIELLERVRLACHSKKDLKYIINMKNNNVQEDEAIYMCAKNKDVDKNNNKKTF